MRIKHLKMTRLPYKIWKRKILRMKTTHVNKNNTNRKVFLNANDKIKIEFYQRNIARHEEEL